MEIFGQVANVEQSAEGDTAVKLTITANPDDERNAAWGVPLENGEGPRIWLWTTPEAAAGLERDTPVVVEVRPV